MKNVNSNLWGNCATTSLYIYCTIFQFLAHYACCSSYCIAPSDSYMFYVKRTLQCKYEAYLWIELSSYFPRGGLWDECLNFLTCFHFQFVLRSQKGESFWWCGGLKTLLSSFFDSRFSHLTFSNADVEVILSYLMLIVLKIFQII